MVQVPFSAPALHDILSALLVWEAPLPGGLSLVLVEEAHMVASAHQATLPLLSVANFPFDLAFSLRRLESLDSREAVDVSTLLSFMASIAEASAHLLQAPLVDWLVAAFKLTCVVVALRPRCCPQFWPGN